MCCICGHVVVCHSVVVFAMHIALARLVDVDNLTFEFRNLKVYCVVIIY